jgi:alkylation response protein AidB-like acyl-CoA dehydrogenase
MGYRAPQADIRFALDHVGQLGDLLGLASFDHLDTGLSGEMITEAARFVENVIAPTNRAGDTAGVRFDGRDVRVPEAFGAAYRQFSGAGWGAVGYPAEFGGAGAPLTLNIAIREMVVSGNLAFSMCPFLAGGVAAVLLRYGNDDQRERYLPALASGEWSGTMDITEPQAGSDVGACTTHAERTADGGYLIRGQKIFISYGDHDLTEQILHLVLARLPDGPPGSKGLSLFLVPKLLLNPDGSLGPRNDVTVLGVEHKLGLHGAPTCVLAYGEQGRGAVGELVGQEHQGIQAMFTMMNDARLGVGLQGLALAELACQRAVTHARERIQGVPAGTPAGARAAIIEHPDVRRMIMTMTASIAAMRAVVYATARAIDLAEQSGDADARAAWRLRADLLTPTCKAWCTDLGVELISTAMQVFGGMSFIEETGIAQVYRDARITPIYEGTNGIQAIDLAARKLLGDNGGAARDYLRSASATATELGRQDPDLGTALAAGVRVLDQATTLMLSRDQQRRALLATATPYQRLFGTVLGASSLAAGVVHAHAAGAGPETLAKPIALLRFYLNTVLPQVHGLLPQVAIGDEGLYSLTAGQLTA